jgi:hypothetical protein
MQWLVGGLRNKKKKAYLDGGEELSVVFLVVLGSLVCGWWRQR